MGLFLASAGVLAYEVLLTRVLSVVMWYHFASMAIAVAMFGLSVGGLLPYVFRGRAPSDAALCAASALFAALPYGILLLFARDPLWAGRVLSVFHQPYFEPFRTAGPDAAAESGGAASIALFLFVFSLPFAGAGAVLARAFSARGREGKTYLLTMAGSAAGVIAYLAAMRAGSGPAAFPLLASLFSLAAAAYSRPGGSGPFLRRNGAALFLAASVLLLAAGAAEARSGAAEIRFVRGRYEPALLWTRWDANSRVAVYPVSGEESSKAWGVSPSYDGPAPEQIGMVVDDTGYTALFGTGANPSALRAFAHNVASAAYRIRGRGKALVIGPGGGKDILCALASGDFRVTAVEVNPLVVRAADVEFAAFTGRPYRMPGVRAVVAEGRSFLAGDRERYDVIQMTQVFGRVPPAAGAFTMTEDHLYTTGAFREYLGHLNRDGILSVTRFIHERRVWRILATAREALLSLGAADPARHVLAFRDRGLVNILVRRTPWPEDELAAARSFSDGMRFPVILDPAVPAAGLPGKILAGTADPGETGPFDFSAPTDDRPFFYYTLRPAAFLSGIAGAAAEFEDRAVATLRAFLVAAGFLCVVFLGLPAAALARRDGAAPGVLPAAYMFGIGLAYIVWEIVMIKRLALLLGSPVLSFAAGLSMTLAFSGVGGYAAGRLARSWSPAVVPAAVIVVSAYLVVAGPRLADFAGLSAPARVLVAAAFVLPTSLVMGTFFPAGLERFRRDGGRCAPFYFAANGAASVLGAAAAQALAMNLGYRAATVAGGCVYLGCAALLGAARPAGDAGT